MADSWQHDFHYAVAHKNADAMRRAIANGLPIDKHVLGYSNEFNPLGEKRGQVSFTRQKGSLLFVLGE